MTSEHVPDGQNNKIVNNKIKIFNCINDLKCRPFNTDFILLSIYMGGGLEVQWWSEPTILELSIKARLNVIIMKQ